MRSMPQWWNRQHGVLRWTAGIALCAGLYALGHLLVASIFDLDPASDRSLISWLFILVSLPLVPVGALVQRRRLGGRGQLSLYRQAYRTGVVPEGADVERWRPVVRKQLRFIREGRRVHLIWWSLMLAAVVAAIGTILVRGTASYLIFILPVLGLLTVLVVVSAWGLDRLWRWRQGQFERLSRALGQERATEPAG
ncbi:hypothetical protein [Aeromicrobium yanjiei]|uniref:Uncharacterized protein n=1 Tax=Aeromicrobium yanjiei TaxID=2662028 RepID=A0A5Q2MFA1_9ACTN|nr:hypothetical protein [Aeromicrobium yanjiei]QGG40389.1 hypothetical protein GEV26_02835 [Aeromicrobium yanjiei]